MNNSISIYIYERDFSRKRNTKFNDLILRFAKYKRVDSKDIKTRRGSRLVHPQPRLKAYIQAMVG